RFELVPDQRPTVILEPWGISLPTSHGPVYRGPARETIKVWGRRRLSVLTRLLPMAEKFEVHLLGSGLPSIWVARMGEMHFSLCLSGWTKNDWTRGVQLDLLSGHWQTSPRRNQIVKTLQQAPALSLSELRTAVSHDDIGGDLHALAKMGQVIFDHASNKVRFREALPSTLAARLISEPHPEWTGAQALLCEQKVYVARSDTLADGRRLLVGKVGPTSVEAIIDSDGVFRSARCSCRYLRQNRLRAGPCRHVLALRLRAEQTVNRPKEAL
ncbi:MAG: SWIM zinc finger family protein, partial [Myxococcota bacterium]